MKLLLFLVVGLFFCSCGYRLGSSSCLDTNKTIMIPYVRGDLDGTFTQELIKQVSRTTELRYVSSCADYILCVTFVDRKEDAIGYRYERTYENQLGKRLVASEERVTLIAKVELMDFRTKKVIAGPFCIADSINYDFAPETSPQNDTTFSLGQLDFKPAAVDAARAPLHRSLAKKIVDYLVYASF
ncbi:MAG: LPS assembly lipoprotein LptE [Chlamydiales bacterium]|nr:LPS assembly lipoprotein LptE [Chlamydiales bacterium]